MTMIAFDELADAIARKIVMAMTDDELVDAMHDNYEIISMAHDFNIEQFMHEHFATYYAETATEDEITAVARQLGIEVESYLIGDNDEQL
jgi:hypothetical protein